MVAKKYNIDFVFNEKFPINSLKLMRGFKVKDEVKMNTLIDFLMLTGY